MPPRSLRVAVASVVLLATAACGGDDAAPTAADDGAKDGVTVPVIRLAYDPTELKVAPGTTVTWRNDEPITHTVTSGSVTGVDGTSGLRTAEKADGRFDGALDAKGATFEYRFADPGTYSYFCTIHKGMNATVVVA